MQSKQQRLTIVNEIIKEIALRGRKFCYSNKTGITAELSINRGKFYYRCEHTDKLLCISSRYDVTPKGWQHGGTIWGLIKDMRDFVKEGVETNHRHGYGGLFSSNWGYPESDMIAIREKAFELGYLITKR